MCDDFDALDDQTLHRAMHDTMFTLQFIFYQVGVHKGGTLIDYPFYQ
jgi:hypothetical protein